MKEENIFIGIIITLAIFSCTVLPLVFLNSIEPLDDEISSLSVSIERINDSINNINAEVHKRDYFVSNKAQIKYKIPPNILIVNGVKTP